MPASVLDIWNMALSHLGSSFEVNDIAESSKEAQACRRFYEPCVEELLRDASWPFATRFIELAAVPVNTNDIEYAYAYRYPAGVVTVRRLLNGASRLETNTNKIRYRIGEDDEGKLIFTDFTDDAGVFAEVTYLVTESGRFSPDFTKALSFWLAHNIGPRVANDKTKLIDRAETSYYRAIAKAKANAFNEEVPDQLEDSEFERARE